ncbi:hypothetical protein ALT785_240256 [Alteromonas infernus]
MLATQSNNIQYVGLKHFRALKLLNAYQHLYAKYTANIIPVRLIVESCHIASCH